MFFKLFLGYNIVHIQKVLWILLHHFLFTIWRIANDYCKDFIDRLSLDPAGRGHQNRTAEFRRAD